MQAEAAAPDLGPHPQSRLMFLVHALGINGLLLPLIALAAIVVVALMIWKGKGPAMVGAILLVVPAPIYWSLLSSLSGLASSYEVLYMADVQVKPSELYGGYAEVLITIQVAVGYTIPVFLTAAGGLVHRALTEAAAEKPASLGK